jgi:hypothetical protein
VETGKRFQNCNTGLQRWENFKAAFYTETILQTFALPALSLDAGCGERVSPVEDSLIPCRRWGLERALKKWLRT